MSQSRNFFIWNIGNPILGKVLDEAMKIDENKIAHVEHLVKLNIQVCYPALSKFIQRHVFFLNPLDQVTISIVYKQLQRPFAAINILIVDTMII